MAVLKGNRQGGKLLKTAEVEKDQQRTEAQLGLTRRLRLHAASAHRAKPYGYACTARWPDLCRCPVSTSSPAVGGGPSFPLRRARASGSFRCAIWREASLMPREEASALSSASYSAAARAPSPSFRCMFATERSSEAVGRSRCAASNHAAAPAKSRCWLAATPRACCSSASAASASLTSSPLPSPSSSSAATPRASSGSSSGSSFIIPNLSSLENTFLSPGCNPNESGVSGVIVVCCGGT